MANSKERLYTIPSRYRKMENMHIVFWLLKDISWCLTWKVLAMLMIFPTLIISIVIAWRTRKVQSELAHNLAITFWITANSLWMITEFYGFDTTIIWKQFEGKHLALIPFLIGILILAVYYAFGKKYDEEEVQLEIIHHQNKK